MDQNKLSSNLNKIFAAISPINLQITQCVSQSLARLSTEFGSFSRNRSRVRAENPFPFERIESKIIRVRHSFDVEEKRGTSMASQIEAEVLCC